MMRKQQGITLIEVLTAMVIIGILAGVAIPAYQNTVSKTRRADGKGLAIDIAAREERHFMQYNTYTTDIAGASGLNTSADSSEGYYSAAVAACGSGTIASCFTVTVTARDAQLKSDENCKTLTLTNTGIKGSTNAKDEASTGCW